MRKLALIGATLSALLVMAALAVAADAPTITVESAVTPTDAGTSKKPKNGLIHIVFNVNKESESTLSGIDYTIPAGVKIDGTGFKKTCSADFINANGDGSCNDAKVGTGAATAILGKNPGSNLNFDVGVFVAGPKALTLYLKTSLFNIAIPATIEGQHVKFDIPKRVQSPVEGLYSYVTSVTADLGVQDGIPAATKVKQKYKKTITVKKRKKNGKVVKRKKRVTRTRTVKKYFVSSVSCPSGGYSVGVTAFLAANPDPPQVPSISGTTTAPCS